MIEKSFSKKLIIFLGLNLYAIASISQEKINKIYPEAQILQPLAPPSPRLSGIHEFNNKPQSISRPIIVQQAPLNQDLNRCTQDGGTLTCFNHPHDPRTLYRSFDINRKFSP